MDIRDLKEIGLKVTPQRLAIIEYLDGNKEHPTAEDIYKAVSKKYPSMSLATVYNTLEVLKKAGVITELKIDPEKKRFDPNTTPHHHIICMGCGKIVDLYIDYKLSVPEKTGFEITGNHIEFYGYCVRCKRNS